MSTPGEEIVDNSTQEDHIQHDWDLPIGGLAGIAVAALAYKGLDHLYEPLRSTRVQELMTSVGFGLGVAVTYIVTRVNHQELLDIHAQIAPPEAHLE